MKFLYLQQCPFNFYKNAIYNPVWAFKLWLWCLWWAKTLRRLLGELLHSRMLMWKGVKSFSCFHSFKGKATNKRKLWCFHLKFSWVLINRILYCALTDSWSWVDSGWEWVGSWDWQENFLIKIIWSLYNETTNQTKSLIKIKTLTVPFRESLNQKGEIRKGILWTVSRTDSSSQDSFWSGKISYLFCCLI